MSIRINNTTDSLKRTISAPGSGTDPFTILVWVKLISNVSAYATLIDLGDTYPESAVLRTGSDGIVLNLFSSGMNVSGSDSLSVGVWAYIGITRGGGTYTIYKDGINIGEVDDFGPVTGTTIQFGNNPFGEYIDAEFENPRAWSRALSQAEIALEMASTTVVETDSLFADWDMDDSVTAGNDRSSNGNDLIATNISDGVSEPLIYEETPVTTYYVNIDRSYTTTGDGSEGNQFNCTQFYAMKPGTAGDVFLLRGYREYIPASDSAFVEGNTAYAFSFDPGITIGPQDIENPTVFHYPSALDDKQFSITGPGVNNIIIDWANKINLGQGPYRNLYAKTGIVGDEGINCSGQAVDFAGCTLIADPDYPLAIYFQAALPTDFLENCLIYGGVSYYVADETVGLAFTNCVFSVANEAAIEDYVEEFEGVPAMFTTPQYGWIPATEFPGGLSVKNGFTEQVLAPDSTENDISINASGWFDGYIQGLFGGPERTVEHGIGAFYFGEPTIEPPTPEEEIPKPDIKDLPVRGLRLGRYVTGLTGGFRPYGEAPKIEQGYIPPLPPFVETIRHTSEGPEGGFKEGA